VKIKEISPFNKNVLTLLTGSVLGQMVPIILAPILARLYTPEDFGILSLFLTTTAILSLVSSGRYELAIILPKSSSDGFHILILSMLITLFASVGILIVVYCFIRLEIPFFVNNSNWIYSVPLAVLLMGMTQSVNMWNNRVAKYRLIATSRILMFGLIVVSLFLSSWSELGLVIGRLFGILAATFFVLWMLFKTYKNQLRQINNEQLIKNLRQYNDHPKNLIVSHFIGTLSSKLPFFVIAELFSTAILGLYFQAIRFIELPTAHLATNIGDVYRQQAAEAYKKYGRFDKLFISTLKKTVSLGLLPFILFLAFAPYFFTKVLGEQWTESGYYSQIIAVYAFFSFVSTPLDKGAIIVGNLKYIFYWQIIRLILNLLAITYIYYFKADFYDFLILLTITNVILYTADLLIEYQFSKGKKEIWN
jgi:O-antigen/teichoic acid export membrane protein